MDPPTPENEHERLACLDEYKILDTAPEGLYEEIIDLACYTCQAPMAAISIVGDERQWFKAKRGLDYRESPREEAFCSFALPAPDKLLIIEDTLTDPRFKGNPAVTGSPNIRFYAGAPLKTPEGHALGTLCIMDETPRDLHPKQAHFLKSLSQIVVAMLELRRKSHSLLDTQRRLTQSNHDLEHLAHNLQQELRTPLQEIHEYSRRLLQNHRHALDENGQHLLDRTRATAFLADERTEALAGLAHISQRTIQREPVDLHGIATLTLEHLENKDIDRPVEWFVQQDLSANADPVLAEILLKHLIENAWTATKDETPARIIIQQDTNPPHRIHVKDNGPGIPRKEQDTLFDTLHANEGPNGQTGTELAIAKRIVQRHGGDIDLQSEPNEGTTIHFTLPNPDQEPTTATRFST